jgi:uncharacterized membrane protein
MTKTTTIEHKASLVLRAGIWSSGLLMGFGLLLALISGVGGAPASTSIADIFRFALGNPLHPLTLIYAGLVLLMFTPILRVVAALIGFAVERDHRFVLVSATVLILLLCEVGYSLFVK